MATGFAKLRSATFVNNGNNPTTSGSIVSHSNNTSVIAAGGTSGMARFKRTASVAMIMSKMNPDDVELLTDTNNFSLSFKELQYIAGVIDAKMNTSLSFEEAETLVSGIISSLPGSASSLVSASEMQLLAHLSGVRPNTLITQQQVVHMVDVYKRLQGIRQKHAERAKKARMVTAIAACVADDEEEDEIALSLNTLCEALVRGGSGGSEVGGGDDALKALLQISDTFKVDTSLVADGATNGGAAGNSTEKKTAAVQNSNDATAAPSLGAAGLTITSLSSVFKPINRRLVALFLQFGAYDPNELPDSEETAATSGAGSPATATRGNTLGDASVRRLQQFGDSLLAEDIESFQLRCKQFREELYQRKFLESAGYNGNGGVSGGSSSNMSRSLNGSTNSSAAPIGPHSPQIISKFRRVVTRAFEHHFVAELKQEAERELESTADVHSNLDSPSNHHRAGESEGGPQSSGGQSPTATHPAPPFPVNGKVNKVTFIGSNGEVDEERIGQQAKTNAQEKYTSLTDVGHLNFDDFSVVMQYLGFGIKLAPLVEQPPQPDTQLSSLPQNGAYTGAPSALKVSPRQSTVRVPAAYDAHISSSTTPQEDGSAPLEPISNGSVGGTEEAFELDFMGSMLPSTAIATSGTYSMQHRQSIGVMSSHSGASFDDESPADAKLPGSHRPSHAHGALPHALSQSTQPSKAHHHGNRLSYAPIPGVQNDSRSKNSLSDNASGPPQLQSQQAQQQQQLMLSSTRSGAASMQNLLRNSGGYTSFHGGDVSEFYVHLDGELKEMQVPPLTERDEEVLKRTGAGLFTCRLPGSRNYDHVQPRLHDEPGTAYLYHHLYVPSALNTPAESTCTTPQQKPASPTTTPTARNGLMVHPLSSPPRFKRNNDDDVAVVQVSSPPPPPIPLPPAMSSIAGRSVAPPVQKRSGDTPTSAMKQQSKQLSGSVEPPRRKVSPPPAVAPTPPQMSQKSKDGLPPRTPPTAVAAKDEASPAPRPPPPRTDGTPSSQPLRRPSLSTTNITTGTSSRQGSAAKSKQLPPSDEMERNLIRLSTVGTTKAKLPDVPDTHLLNVSPELVLQDPDENAMPHYQRPRGAAAGRMGSGNSYQRSSVGRSRQLSSIPRSSLAASAPRSSQPSQYNRSLVTVSRATAHSARGQRGSSRSPRTKRSPSSARAPAGTPALWSVLPDSVLDAIDDINGGGVSRSLGTSPALVNHTQPGSVVGSRSPQRGNSKRPSPSNSAFGSPMFTQRGNHQSGGGGGAPSRETSAVRSNRNSPISNDGEAAPPMVAEATRAFPPLAKTASASSNSNVVVAGGAVDVYSEAKQPEPQDAEGVFHGSMMAYYRSCHVLTEHHTDGVEPLLHPDATTSPMKSPQQQQIGSASKPTSGVSNRKSSQDSYSSGGPVSQRYPESGRTSLMTSSTMLNNSATPSTA